MATERRYLDRGRLLAPGQLPAREQLLARSAQENFPVALRLLPSRQRDDLLAIYGFARLVDYAGDELPGDRLAALDWIDAELDRALAGQPSHLLIARAATTVRSRRLDDALMRRLIEANRQDQRIDRYPTFPDLLEYCELSANPVGRLVLGVFEVSTPERERWSDLVCTGLQLAEHWQDVAEDAAAGRIYLPLEDLQRFGVAPEELTSAVSSEAMRGLIGFEVARARGLLDQGVPLIRSMRGSARVAVAGFVAGGQAALDGIARAGFDVLATGRPTRPTRRQFVRRMIPALRHTAKGTPWT